jgi:hypothetical protein
MGGIGEGGVFNAFQGVSSAPAPAPSNNGLAQAQAAANAAADAAAAAQLKQQQQTDYNNELSSAQNQATAGQQTAQQQISGYNTNQQQADQTTLTNQASGTQALANQATGGGSFNPTAASKLGMANLGGSASVASANSGISQNLNPAAQAQAATQTNTTGIGSNQFTLPSTSGIKLGGS